MTSEASEPTWLTDLETLSVEISRKMNALKTEYANKSAPALQKAFVPIFEAYPLLEAIEWYHHPYNDECYAGDFELFGEIALDEHMEEFTSAHDDIDTLVNHGIGGLLVAIFENESVYVTREGVET